MGYKFLEHTADIKFLARGESIEEAFKFSAYALFESIYGDVKIEKKIKKEIVVGGEDNKSLLYSFLEEFLFLLDSENLVFCEVKEININENKLSAVVLGDYSYNYNFSNEVKAITYNDMFIEKKRNEWTIQGVFDV